MDNPVAYKVTQLGEDELVPLTPFPAYLRREFSYAPLELHENMLDCMVAELARHVYDRGWWDGQASATITLYFCNSAERRFEITAEFTDPMISIEEIK